MTKLSNLITKVKNSFDISYEELKLKPQILEADENNIKYLEKEVLDNSEFVFEVAKKNAERYLKGKFFPIELRPKLWSCMFENKHRLNPKLYKSYSEIVQKKLTENENYGINS